MCICMLFAYELPWTWGTAGASLTAEKTRDSMGDEELHLTEGIEGYFRFYYQGERDSQTKKKREHSLTRGLRPRTPRIYRVRARMVVLDSEHLHRG